MAAGALLVLGLVAFFTRYKVKKIQLRATQKRSDQVEALLQQMDEALWDEQESRLVESPILPAQIVNLYDP